MNHASHAVRQSRPRPAKTPRTIIPTPQSTRIVGRFIAGESVRSIARAENRDRATVAKIVRGPEVNQYFEELRARFFGTMEIAMETLLEELKNPNSKTRGWLAFEALKSGGVVPSERERGLPSKTLTILIVICMPGRQAGIAREKPLPTTDT